MTDCWENVQRNDYISFDTKEGWLLTRYLKTDSQHDRIFISVKFTFLAALAWVAPLNCNWIVPIPFPLGALVLELQALLSLRTKANYDTDMSMCSEIFGHYFPYRIFTEEDNRGRPYFLWYYSQMVFIYECFFNPCCIHTIFESIFESLRPCEDLKTITRDKCTSCDSDVWSFPS